MADKKLAQWVKARAPKCRRVASVCTGSFLLAAAGLLEGKRAVTHWTYCNELQRLYPDTQVESDAIYVKDGNVWTSAGVTTGIDLALAMIEEDLGRDLAMLVARILVVYLRRTGGQSQYSVLLAAQSGADADRFAALDRWIAENLAEDLRVEQARREGRHERAQFRAALRGGAQDDARARGRSAQGRCRQARARRDRRAHAPDRAVAAASPTKTRCASPSRARSGFHPSPTAPASRRRRSGARAD